MISTWLSDCRLLTSRCTVEDGSGQALIFMSGDCCRNWLKLPPNVWKVLEETVLPHEGEFLYFSSVSWSMTMSVVFSLPPKTRTLVQSCREWLVWLIITNCVTSEIASSSRQFGLSNLILLLRHVLPLETALARYRRQVRQQRRYVDQSTISLFTPLDLLYTSWFSFLKRRHFCRPISSFYVKSIQPDKSGQQLISSRINHRGGSFACTSANWIQPSVPTSYQVNKRSSPITHTYTHIHFARPSRGLPSQRLPLFDDKSFVPSASSVCLWQGRLLFCHHRRRRFYSFIFPFSSFWKKTRSLSCLAIHLCTRLIAFSDPTPSSPKMDLCLDKQTATFHTAARLLLATLSAFNLQVSVLQSQDGRRKRKQCQNSPARY